MVRKVNNSDEVVGTVHLMERVLGLFLDSPTRKRHVRGVARERGISPRTAKEFGAALGTSAEFWMNLNTAWLLWKSK